MEYERINKLIKAAEKTLTQVVQVSKDEELLVGVDLGTAYIVLVVLDSEKNPVACEMESAEVLRDGLVVDYLGALQTVRRLKQRAEERLGRTLTKAATAIPPGTIENNIKTHVHVVEGAGMEVTNVLDEPTASNEVIGLKNGAIVDVGGGTTGISVFKDGEVIHVTDEPTGGIHLSLCIAGNANIALEEAEEIKKKRERQGDLLPVVTPIIQNMARIVSEAIEGYDVEEIHVVGGTCAFEGFENIMEKELGIKTVKPINPFLVTPIGIAMNC